MPEPEDAPEPEPEDEPEPAPEPEPEATHLQVADDVSANAPEEAAIEEIDGGAPEEELASAPATPSNRGSPAPGSPAPGSPAGGGRRPGILKKKNVFFQICPKPC